MKKRLKGFFQRLARWLNVREMRQHKVKAGVYIIIRLILVSLLTAGILNGKWENVVTCVLTLGLLMLPLFIDRKLSVALPSVLETIVVLFVFAANVMGELGAFYEKIPIWDSLLHTVNGFICAGVGFGLTDILNRSERVKLSLSPMFVCLFSFCFSMTVGVVWEFFEFGADMLFEKDMQKDTIITAIHSGLISGKPNVIMHIRDITSTVVNGENLGINGYLDIGLIDTMKDLLVNFVGAVVFDTIGWFYLKGRSAGFFAEFYPKEEVAAITASRRSKFVQTVAAISDRQSVWL